MTTIEIAQKFFQEFPTYPQYKDAGADWIGLIPIHWESKIIKRLCQVKRGASPRPIDEPSYFDDEGEYAWVRISDVTASDRYLLETEQKLSELGKSKSIPLEPGEIFLSIAASVGKPIITKIKCCIHDGFVYFSNLKENRNYLFYLFSSGQLYSGLGKLGTQLNLNTDTVGDVRIPVPPLKEQEAIAHFLDQATAEIDHIIDQQQQLIALLEEERTTVISHAVTKGLDPSVPMKDSGVEWLGEIPAHWDVKRLKWLVLQIGSGKTPKGGSEIYSESGIVFIRSQNVHFNGLRLEDVVYIDESIDMEMASTRVFSHDVLLNITGASLGRCSVVPQNFPAANVNQHVCIIRPNKLQVTPEFLHSAVSSNVVQAQIFSGENGTSREGLTFSQIANFVLPLPRNLEEQQKITAFIHLEIARIDEAIANVKDQIAKLEEYRTALISDAVTGKIDVRGWAA